jgi:hypothetical protein
MSKTTINHSRLKEFCDTIVMQAREVLYEREEDILKAWHENIEEAQQSEKKFPPLKLALGATVNLEEGTIETTLRFTAVYQSSISAELPDPNQPELPGVEKAVKKFHEEMKKSGASVSIEVVGETVYDSSEDDAEALESAMDFETNSVLDRLPALKHPLKKSAQLAHISARYGLAGLNRMHELAFEREGYCQKSIARIEQAIAELAQPEESADY